MRTVAKILAPACIALFVAGACGGKKDCAAVKEKIVSQAKAEMNKASEEEKKMMAAMGGDKMIEGLAGMVEETCKSQKWTEKQISCVLDAKDEAAMKACDVKMGI